MKKFLLLVIAVLCFPFAAVAADVNFKDYGAWATAATTPLAGTEKVLVLQGGAVKSVAPASLGAGTGTIIASHPYVAVPAGTTTYFNAFSTNATTQSNSDETRVYTASPIACTAKSLYVTTRGTTGATGGVTVKLRKAGADTALVVAIPANTSTTPATFSDTTHTVAIAQGDLITYSIGNADSAANLTVVSVSMVCQ